MMAVCMIGAGFAIVGYSQTVRSQMEGELTGTVTDIGEGAPIPKAYVLVHSEATNKDVGEKVSSRARFDVSLEPGDYDVLIAAPGFAPACKRVEIKSATTTDFSPKLGPDTEHMQIDTIY
jgi:hypothetical protein